MKWFPEPSDPSCIRHFGAICSAWSTPSSSFEFRNRAAPHSASTRWLERPAESGIADEIARCNAARSPVRSASANWVRTAIMPQPMSTPTAAGMIAPTVGITLPTVAPLPRCASGIKARCGRTNGIDAVRSA